MAWTLEKYECEETSWGHNVYRRPLKRPGARYTFLNSGSPASAPRAGRDTKATTGEAEYGTRTLQPCRVRVKFPGCGNCAVATRENGLL